MKCPKCGYNSFEFLNNCKKCGAEFVSFKRTHRISPVVLTPSMAPDVRPAHEEAAIPPPPVPDSVAESHGDEFSWDSSAESNISDQEENPYSGFDLGFQDSVDDVTQDKAFTGFSFSGEPAGPHHEEVSAAEGEGLEEFSFEEAPGEASETSPMEIKVEAPESAIERYERLLDLDSPEVTEDTGKAASGEFDADDFSFAPEPVVEDIFQLKEEPVTPPATEKKAQPNLSDFDKEFEQIFSFGDAEEKDTKS
jgi:predicted  nucleic acid-binding Zn-ribbon protein